MIMKNLDYNPYVHLKSSLLYDWCMFIEFHPLIKYSYSNWQFEFINIFVKLKILQCVYGI